MITLEQTIFIQNQFESQLAELDSLKKQIDFLRPIPEAFMQKILQKWRLDWSYHSNAIEGNLLSYGETKTFILYGLTAKGKPLKDHLDIKGHNEAVEYLIKSVQENEEIRLNHNFICDLHKIVMPDDAYSQAETPLGDRITNKIKVGQYKTTPNHVKTRTGETHYYCPPEETHPRMTDLLDWYHKTKEHDLHPLIVASIFHHEFVNIHPFDDGNGRMSRILNNLILMREGYPPSIIKVDEKDDYYYCLNKADGGEYNDFVVFMRDKLSRSCQLFLKGAKGDDLEEPSDLDKQIFLIKKKLENQKDRISLKKNPEVVTKVWKESIGPLLKQINMTITKFSELFIDSYWSQVFVDSYTREPYINQSISQSIAAIQGKSINRVYVWKYRKSDINNFIYDVQKNENTIIFSYALENFIIENNPFSFEFKIFIQFSEFKFKLNYYFQRINEMNDLKTSIYPVIFPYSQIEKYYHEFISEEEMVNVGNEIGKKGLEIIGLAEKESSKPIFFSLNGKENKINDLIVKYKSFEHLSVTVENNILKFTCRDNTISTEDKIGLAKKFILELKQSLGVFDMLGYQFH
jgi:Fic family protein